MDQEVFEAYDWDTEYRQGIEINDEVCNFIKAMVFSEKTELSEFYWHHPNADKVPIKKIDTHTSDQRSLMSPGKTIGLRVPKAR